MSNIIPFESNTLPAHLRNMDVALVNADLVAHAGGGFPVMSIKGKTWAIVREGERKILMNPLDPSSPAGSIDVVLIKANRGTSKVYYSGGYVEGSTEKPVCFSNDGVAPDAKVENPQSAKCATCKHNAWGSKISDNGSKVKACSDSVRLAIATPDKLDDPYLLRVPAASIRALGDYGKLLASKGVGYQAVLTKIAFDIESPTPKLVFRPVGFIDAPSFAKVQDMVESEIVQNIIGSAAEGIEEDFESAKAKKSEPATTPTKERTVTKEEVVAAVAAAAAPVEPSTANDAAPAKVEVALSLDDLNFDD